MIPPVFLISVIPFLVLFGPVSTTTTLIPHTFFEEIEKRVGVNLLMDSTLQYCTSTMNHFDGLP